MEVVVGEVLVLLHETVTAAVPLAAGPHAVRSTKALRQVARARDMNSILDRPGAGWAASI